MAESQMYREGTNEVPNCRGVSRILIDDIEGKVPGDLWGTFFRIGPGWQRIGDSQYRHWLDVNGMLCSFSFQDSGVHFCNRYVRTPKYIDETAAQAKILLKLPANPANTNTMSLSSSSSGKYNQSK